MKFQRTVFAKNRSYCRNLHSPCKNVECKLVWTSGNKPLFYSTTRLFYSMNQHAFMTMSSKVMDIDHCTMSWTLDKDLNKNFGGQHCNMMMMLGAISSVSQFYLL